jgi:hypothetical protein
LLRHRKNVFEIFLQNNFAKQFFIQNPESLHMKNIDHITAYFLAKLGEIYRNLAKIAENSYHKNTPYVGM